MALHNPRGFTSWALVVALLPALLTFNIQAQMSSNPDRLMDPALASSSIQKSSVKFNNLLTATPQATAVGFSSALPNFIGHRDYLAIGGPDNLAMGDLNADGIPDLVVTTGASDGITPGNVSVLLGNRDGSFGQARLFNTGGIAPFDAVIGDFNGDGKNDIAVTTFEGVPILLGDGRGHLGTPPLFPTEVGSSRLVAADFNGDHKVDLAVTNLGSNTVSILFGKGDGTFAPARNIAVGMGPLGIVVGDFNHDGKADLAVANSGVVFGTNQGPKANTLAILIGNGNGSFGAPTFIPVADTPLAVGRNAFNKGGNKEL